MKLGKLLFAGKSIKRGSQTVHYRQSKQCVLPKFGSPKNPFAPKASEEAAPASPKNGTASSLADAPPMPSISAAPKSLVSWTAKLNPTAIWRGPRAEALGSSRPAVQTELSLDAVKVVHNDLSDVDVQMVPLKSRPAGAASGLPPTKTTWEILGERLLKATAL